MEPTLTSTDRFAMLADEASAHTAGVAEKATDAVRSFAANMAEASDDTVRAVRDTSAKDVLARVRSQVTANPAAYLLGSLALGFVAGRMLRRG